MPAASAATACRGWLAGLLLTATGCQTAPLDDLPPTKSGGGCDHAWAYLAVGGQPDDQASPTAVAVDPTGAIVVVGTFLGDFDIGEENAYARGRKAYVARYRSDGSVHWVKFAGSVSFETSAVDVSVGPDGAITTVGWFEDSTEIDGETLTAKGVYEGLLIRHRSDGDLLWARALPVTQAFELSEASTVVSDRDGVLVAGHLEGTVTLADGTGVTARSARDVMLVGVDAAGAASWATAFGDPSGSGSAEAHALTVAPDGSLLLVGAFRGDLGLGGEQITGMRFSNAFVAALEQDLAIRWIVHAGTDHSGSSVALWDAAGLADGSTVVVGQSQGKIDVAGHALETRGELDGIAVRIGPAGVVSSITRAETRSVVAAASFSSVLARGDGSVVIGGSAANGRVSIGEREIDPSAGLAGLAIAMSADGTVDLMLVAQGHSVSRDLAHVVDLALAPDGDLTVVGTLTGRANVGPFELQTSGAQGAFVARMSSAGAFDCG